MKLRELLSGVNCRIASGDLNTEIFGLAYDSRQVSPDYLFVAIRGSRLDGNRFIPKAIAKGAAAVGLAKLVTVGAGRPRAGRRTVVRAKSG